MKNKKELNYFDEFAKTAKFAKDAAEELKNYIVNIKNINSNDEMNKVHKIENSADNNLHELVNYLLKDFLPPIDREDILAISYRLDDLIDNIDETVINLNIFNITEVTENMKALIELLVNSTSAVYNLVLELKNLKKIKEIKEKVIEVGDIEEQADKLYEKSIKELFENEKDVVQIIKWSKIYEIVENCFDACESIADCIEDILVKNS